MKILSARTWGILLGFFIFISPVFAETLSQEMESGKNWEDDKLFTGITVKNGDSILRSGTEIAVAPASLRGRKISPEGLALLTRDMTAISGGNGNVTYSESHSTGLIETTSEKETDLDSGITVSKRK